MPYRYLGDDDEQVGRVKERRKNYSHSRNYVGNGCAGRVGDQTSYRRGMEISLRVLGRGWRLCKTGRHGDWVLKDYQPET